VLQPDDSAAARRLSDLRRAQPADTTLQNLLGLLNAKLDLCARLPVFEYEAGSDGHDACAAAFRDLAAVERHSFHELLVCLRAHLNESVTATGPGRRPNRFDFDTSPGGNAA
jgi:hypothetical protein